jgi:hypothetical protein
MQIIIHENFKTEIIAIRETNAALVIGDVPIKGSRNYFDIDNFFVCRQKIKGVSISNFQELHLL